MDKIPTDEIQKRIEKIQSTMQQNSVDALIILQGADLYYYCGCFQQGLLWIPQEGHPVFFVRRSHRRAHELASFVTIKEIKSFKQIPDKLQLENVNTIGIESDILPLKQFFSLQKLFPNGNFIDFSQFIRQQRMIKTDFELDIMSQGAILVDQAYTELSSRICAGIREIDVAAELEYILRKKGHQGTIRVRNIHTEFHYGCVLAGLNGAIPGHFDGPLGGEGINPSFPTHSGLRTIAIDSPVIIDYVGCFHGYCIDTTRVFVAGALPQKLMEAQNVALEIEREIVNTAKVGTLCEDIYHLACKMAEESGLANHFQGCEEQVKFVGHGVGIELNELPVLAKGMKTPLAPGMTIAIEPKFMFADLGAVGVENTFVVREEGLESLTKYQGAPTCISKE